jgi:hypothetical protein
MPDAFLGEDQADFSGKRAKRELEELPQSRQL